jgi:hypothetical protein
VHSLVFAVNKLDAVADPALAFAHIRAALQLAQDAGIQSPPCPSRRSRAGTWSTPSGLVRLPGPQPAATAGTAATHRRTRDCRWPFRCSGWKSPPLRRPTRARAGACSGAAWPRARWRRGAGAACSPAASWRSWPRCWTMLAGRPGWTPAAAPASPRPRGGCLARRLDPRCAQRGSTGRRRL